MKSRYPNGFAGGAVIRDMPHHEAHPGKVFWVGNNASVLDGEKAASDQADAGSFLKPLASIDYAVGLCKANRGDVIYVRPNYSETITSASAIDIDVAGVSVIGLGHGSAMATIEFNHAAATVAIGADDVVLQNLKLNASITGVVDGVIVEDGVNNAVIRNCLFDVDATGTDEFIDCISLVNNNSRCVVEDCVMDMGLGGAVSAIHADADTAFLVIRNNVIRGDFSTANIVGDTTLSTNVDIQGNLLENGIGGDLNAQPCIELLTGSTGTIRDNYLVCNLATKAASVVADTCMLFENYYNEDISSAATGGIIGAASADD